MKLSPALRSKIIYSIHSFFNERSFVFVDVPEMVEFPGIEANIDFFEVDEQYFLHPSPEIALKKIISKHGIQRSYYLGHVFRKEEEDPLHKKEFLMAEWYRVGEGLDVIEKDIWNLILTIGEILLDNGFNIDVPSILSKRFFIPDVLKEKFGLELCKDPPEKIRNKMIKILGRGKNYSLDDLFFSIWIDIEEKLKREEKTFSLWNYPLFVSSLAEQDEDCPGIVKRFEFFLNGIEIANAYYELRGTENYEKRFSLINRLRAEKGLKPVKVDEEFLFLMDKFPPTAGVALGVDRTIMALLNLDNIDDVVYS